MGGLNLLFDYFSYRVVYAIIASHFTLTLDAL